MTGIQQVDPVGFGGVAHFQSGEGSFHVICMAFHPFRIPYNRGLFDGVPQTVDHVKALLLGVGGEVKLEDS